MSLRTSLRTCARGAVSLSRFLLVYILCLSMVLLLVPLARADFPDADGNFTLWLDAGRAPHTFEIWDPALSGGISFSGMGSLVQPGGTRITGTLPVGTPGLVVRDTTSGEVAQITQLPSDVIGEAHVAAVAWTSESGNPVHTLHFLVDSARAGHSLILSQPNGTYFVASPAGRWVGSLAEFSSPYAPSLPYRVLDLTTGEQSEQNASDTSLNAWAELNAPPPLASVTIAVDAIEEGHWFTIHAQHPGGPELLRRVQAVRGSFDTYGNGMWWDQNATILVASVALGMNITVERDADHWSVGGMQASVAGGSNQSISLSGSFPEVPDRGHPSSPQQFSIVGEQATNPMYQDAGYTLWFADGYRTDFSLNSPGYNSANELRTWTTTPLRDGTGAVLAPMDLDGNRTTHYAYQITLDVDPQQSWWLVNNATGEQYPIGKSEILGSYQGYHASAPPSDWSGLTLYLHSLRSDSELTLSFSYPSGNVSEMMLSAMSSDAPYAVLLGGPSETHYPLTPSSESFSFYSEWTDEVFSLHGLSVAIPNPRLYEWPSTITTTVSKQSNHEVE